MAPINLPEEALPDLTKIADADQEFFDSLVSVIEAAEPTLTRGQFETTILEKIKSDRKADVGPILRATVALFYFREQFELSPDDLARGVVESDLIAEAKDFPPEKKETLRGRLASLLSLDKSLGVTSKALDVMTEHERVFCDARILSDIRPVFVHSSKEAAGAVVVHNLQIGFSEGGDRRELYFALDTKDIQILKKTIERAEKKTIALEAILRKAEVPYLEV